MLNETRVNLKHLLEDIRDSYTAPLEEVIVTELIANALDSKAHRIDFIVSSENGFLRCIDNGLGMKRPQLKEYHNIAASAKQKGPSSGPQPEEEPRQEEKPKGGKDDIIDAEYKAED